MNTIRPCGCKGVRSCLECEENYHIEKPSLQSQLQQLEPWSYCVPCERLYPGWSPEAVRAQHAHHDKSQGIELPGMFVQENFISESESTQLMQDLDALPWTVSQSGRRKQNYGPKTNFKKRKIQNGNFVGFPKNTEYVQTRLREMSLLSDFQTIEQCSLEYDPSKGACIDPHVDDCWIWGERVVTVNCLGDAVLTLILCDDAHMPASKYNLDLVPQYEHELLLPLLPDEKLQIYKERVIRVPMPNRSLMVMYGPARYQFQHAVLREDINERRVCIAYREFTPMYLAGGESQTQGEGILNTAQKFWTTMETCAQAEAQQEQNTMAVNCFVK